MDIIGIRKVNKVGTYMSFGYLCVCRFLL